MEQRKRLEPDNCRHALKYSPDNGVTTEIHWDCVKCGAVAYFHPSASIFVPRES